nr:O-antigen ligase family protein [Armatimonadota bacterium]
ISALSRREQSPVFGLLWGLIALAQLATLVTTGSRFALLSLTVAAIVFGLAWRAARPQGEGRAQVNTRGAIAAVVCIVLIGLVFARPVLNRLQNSQANSAAFRVWTWKGAARMAAQNPLLGTGIGTWVDTYPPYALTGFTRLTHNSYLQMADECGLPALAALLATLGLVGLAARRRLAATPEQALDAAPLLTAIAPADDRLLRCGLLAGLAAGVVQNVIDSDWYVFFIGVTFWALAGLAVGLGDRAEDKKAGPKTPRARLVLSGLAAVALLVLFGTQGVAAFYNGQAQRESDPVAAQLAYSQAQAWDPLNARYPGDLGYRVFARTGNFTAAEAPLRAAAAMEPNGVNFQRLAAVLSAQGRRTESLAAYQDGLRVDPNKLDLLLGAARLSPPAEALAYYRKMADLEDGPVGQVRAIGELTEPKFAEADAALAQAAAQAGNPTETVRFAQRAANVLEAYAREGGTANAQRQILNGFRPRPNDDAAYRDLYARVMAAWADATLADQKLAVRSRAQDYAMRFGAILAQDHAALGNAANSAGDATQAATEYSRAAELLQRYADAGSTHSGQKQGLTDGRSDPALDAQMGTLYGHVMERLLAITPPEQRGALTDRARLYVAKFAALVSPG